MSEPTETMICPHCGWQAYRVQGRCSHCKEPLDEPVPVQGASASGRSEGSLVVNTYPDADRAGATVPIAQVTVVDVDMPFGSMVFFMVKWAIASIPAFLILILLGALISAVLGGIFGGLIGPAR